MSIARHLLVIVALLLGGSSIGCSGEPGADETAVLSIDAEDGDGHRAHVGCEILPSLQGSRLYVTYVLDEDRVTLTVTAEPGQVSIVATADKRTLGTRTVPRSALVHGTEIEPLELLLLDGGRYTIELGSECPQ